MQIYMVGGAVRDRLWAAPSMTTTGWWWVPRPSRCWNWATCPWAAIFRCFCPETREEYALARTERKSGRGYRGFVVESSPNVTLEEDLSGATSLSIP